MVRLSRFARSTVTTLRFSRRLHENTDNSHGLDSESTQYYRTPDRMDSGNSGTGGPAEIVVHPTAL